MAARLETNELRRRRGAGAADMARLDRAARRPQLLETATEAGERLREARIVVVGLGSIGSHLANLIARWSPASLTLVDRADFKAESVLTHPSHPRDIGRSKARVAGEDAKAVSPATRVIVHEGAVEDLPLGTFIGADAVLLASDNLACELEVTRRCTQLGLRLIQASVHGVTLVAQVRSLRNLPAGGGACLACGYQAADWEALDLGTQFSCGGEATSRAASPTKTPTVSPPELCAQAACMALTELSGHLQGVFESDEGRMLESCGYTHATTVTPLVRREACPEEHKAAELVPWGMSLQQTSVGHLFETANGGCDYELNDLALLVEGERFARLGACACPEHPELGRFLPIAEEPGICAGCGLPLIAHPFYTHVRTPGGVLSGHLDRSLAELGARVSGTVAVQNGEHTTLFYPQPQHKARS